MPAIVIEEPPALYCRVGAVNPRRCKMKSNWRPPFAANPNVPSFRCSTKRAWARRWTRPTRKAWWKRFRTRQTQPRRTHQPGPPENCRRLHLCIPVAVCAMMVALAKQIGLSEEHTAAPGMAGPAARPGQGRHPAARSEQAWQAHRQRVRGGQSHPVEGYNLLKEGGNVEDSVLDACLHHHEKWTAQATPTSCRATRSR